MSNTFQFKPLVMRPAIFCIGAFLLSGVVNAQQTLTWEQVRSRFEADNPGLQAAKLAIDESRAAETTAYLRPNPTVTGTLDQINPFWKQPAPDGSPGSAYRPFAFALPSGAIDYLHERQHKRELRRDSAKTATDITTFAAADQGRTLLFALRSAFVQTLEQKAVLALAHENLSYYDQFLTLSRTRRTAGDIAQVDLDRLELQRVQYETDVQTATVNLRTAKIQLLTLLNDRSSVDTFDVTGPYDFPDQIPALEQFRETALEARPDLKEAVQAVEKAKIDNRLAWANGSVDPIFGLDVARNPPIPAYIGASVTIPLRIFDRNQGEKARTQIDIGRNERLRDAAEAQVFSDVDSAYATVTTSLNLLKTYRATYLQQAIRVRDTIQFAYQNGGASLLDYLQAQQEYRSVQLNNLNLIGAYLTAAGQLNLAVGREVIP